MTDNKINPVKSSKVLDEVQMRIINIEEAIEAFRKIVKRQAILLNILQRKMGVTDEEILGEEKRLNAELGKHPKGSQ